MGRKEQFIRVLLDHSDSDRYEEAVLEWQQGFEQHGEQMVNCICGQDIIHNYPVHHARTRQELIIGSCCIRKFGQSIAQMDRSLAGRLKWARQHATKKELEILDGAEKHRFRIQIDLIGRLTGKPIPKNWNVDESINTIKDLKGIRDTLHNRAKQIIQARKRANAWETEFLTSVQFTYIYNPNQLSKKQLAVLRRMGCTH